MIQIDTANRIVLDGMDTGLAVTQDADGTRVYTPECRITGIEYRRHQMHYRRYSLACDTPASGIPGRGQFEADIRAILEVRP